MATLVAVEESVHMGVQAVQAVAQSAQVVSQGVAGVQAATLTVSQVAEIEALTAELVSMGIEAAEAGIMATEAVVEVSAEMTSGANALRAGAEIGKVATQATEVAATGMSTTGKVFAIGGGALAIVGGGVQFGFAIHHLVNGHPTAATVQSLAAQMQRKIATAAACSRKPTSCAELAKASANALQRYTEAHADLKKLSESISVHNGWTQGSNIAGAGLGIASGILWILAVPTLGATTIPAAITTGAGLATSSGALIGDLARSAGFRGRTREISDSWKTEEIDFKSWFGAQHLADHVLNIRENFPSTLTSKSKRLECLEGQFQPLGEVTSVCDKTWLTKSRDELIKEIKEQVFDLCHRNGILPLVAVSDANELLGMATVEKSGFLNVDPKVKVATVLNVRKLHASAKGVAKILYTEAFQAVASEAGIDGIFISNAAKTLPEKLANVKGMLFAAGVTGHTKVLNVKSAQSWAARELAQGGDGNIDVEKADTFLFMKP